MDFTKYSYLIILIISILTATLYVFSINPGTFKKYRKADRFKLISTVIAAMAGVMTIIFSLLSGDRSNFLKTKTEIINERIDRILIENMELQKQIKLYENKYFAIDRDSINLLNTDT